MEYLEFTEILEIIVLGAIAIELYALYSHSKLDHRIDEHILDTAKHLERANTLIDKLDGRLENFDERIIRFDEHMNKLDEHITRLDEHVIRHDKQMNVIDELTWRTYLERTGNNIQESKQQL